ncbi:MAG: acyl carrier protein [Opitutaceae bacterium]|nr:acyl carrier protein [Opitutaceae bacterium]
MDFPQPERTPDDKLGAALRHCSRTTLEAARRFRRTRDAVHLPPVLLGVLEHYAGPEARPVLRQAHDGLRLTEDLGLDSLTRIEMALLLEEVLQLSLPEERLRELQTLGDMRRLAENAVRPGAAA